MANAKEESILDKVERELQSFIENKTTMESELQKELNRLSNDYAIAKNEAIKKYDITELDKDIKKHTYFLKLLKGEVAIPDDLKATRRINKRLSSENLPKPPANFTIPRTYDEAKSDNQKVYFAIKELGLATNIQILQKVNSYGASFDMKGISNAVNNLKNKFKVVTKDKEKVGKALKYKIS